MKIPLPTPTLEIQSPADGTAFPVGTTVLVSGFLILAGEPAKIVEYKTLKEVRRYCCDQCLWTGGNMRILEVLAHRQRKKQEKIRRNARKQMELLDQSIFTEGRSW